MNTAIQDLTPLWVYNAAWVMKKRIRVHIDGTVQGVGFRPFVYRIAVRVGLAGHVRNLGDAGVEIEIEGNEQAIASFLKALKEETPPLAAIAGMHLEDLPPQGQQRFSIHASSTAGDGGGALPPDVATCTPCLEDIDAPEGRYAGYWATSCTDCGPRFTVIEGLPYDRPLTSMRDFPMCAACRAEYEDPLDRRYHAQTIACPACGPSLAFVADGRENREDPLSSAVRVLNRGGLIAIKGIGGTHVACDATREPSVAELRRRLGRSAQPFALMARPDMVEGFADVTPEEWALLRSPRRPIVAVRAKGVGVAPSVAPGLHTVGVMLPYTGLHHLLLRQVGFPLVMTSANFPGLPMLVDNEAILTQLGHLLDGVLLHDRRIVARCDDSVMRMAGGGPVFLRRSRGYVPEPLAVDLGDAPLLALGGETGVVAALYHRGKVFLSQHIGDTDKLDTLEFLREAIEHLMRITGAPRPKVIGCDLHPGFATAKLAAELGHAVPVQHHVAHVAALACEWGLEELVGVAADGYGYGTDGTAWGGEVIAWRGGNWERAGSLREVPLPGGDLAARRPGRMAASYLIAAGEDPSAAGLPPDEIEIVKTQISRGLNAPATTSAGRFLDAVAAWLGLCRARTYEGEPAMRLEAIAATGRPHPLVSSIAPGPDRLTLDTVGLFRQLVEFRRRGTSTPDLAATAQAALAEGLARLAAHVAAREGMSTVGLTGGVAVNDCIAWAVRQAVEEAGPVFCAHRAVPPGDGGVALGQLVVAAGA